MTEVIISFIGGFSTAFVMFVFLGIAAVIFNKKKIDGGK